MTTVVSLANMSDAVTTGRYHNYGNGHVRTQYDGLAP
jgi:hypothetical protein